MKTPTEDFDLIRWLDGEMSAAELERFTARLESDPALKAEADFMQRMCADVRSALPAEVAVPYGDFFNSQIQVRLAQEGQEEAAVLPREKSSWLEWFRLPSFATVAAVAAAVVTAGVMIFQQSGEDGGSLVLSSYAPDGKVQVSAYQSVEAEATVLMLEGLEAIPADRKIVGYHIDRSEMNTEMAATTLYGSGGEALLVVSSDSRNQPRLLAAALPR